MRSSSCFFFSQNMMTLSSYICKPDIPNLLSNYTMGSNPFWSSILNLMHDFVFQFYSFHIVTFYDYCKVASSRLYWLVALPKIFRRLMNGKFDVHVLWPLAKRFQNWIVAQSTVFHYMVLDSKCKMLKKDKFLLKLPNTQEASQARFVVFKLLHQINHSRGLPEITALY